MNAGRLTIVVLTFALSSIVAPSQERVLHDFGSGRDGAGPFGNVVFDAAGNLYGTTQNGGTYGYGTVYKLTAGQNGTWTESVIHNFNPNNGDGIAPQAGLAIDAAGNLYGTTWGGGGTGPGRFGTVFKLAPGAGGTWSETILHAFLQYEGRPMSQPILDRAGNLYGTSAGEETPGVVWQLTPNRDGGWTETVLHTFTGDDGFGPAAGVTLDVAGNLYGTTEEGGRYSLGVVYKLFHTPSGMWIETVLHHFTGGSDGAYPASTVVLDAHGNIYGTTFGGGNHNCEFGCGVAFELSSPGVGGWLLTTLYIFTGGADGANPEAGMTFDSTGDLYGTTTFGGNLQICGAGCGTVFKLAPSGNGQWLETVLEAFPDGPDGDAPYGGVVFGPGSDLYGTTSGGGSSECECGIIYEVTP
jgi:uncharacterized repeat protein (TIGR03803 family)